MALTGKQYKLDKNKDGKISGEDFKMLRKMEMGGATDIAQAILGEAGKTISDADRERIDRIVGQIKSGGRFNSQTSNKFLMDLLGESGKTISDADRERIDRIIGEMKARPQKMKKGGEVKVKSKKRTVKKKTSMTSRGAGAALRGTKFVGVR